MKIAFFGDVVGKPGRAAVLEHLPGLKARLRLDFVVVNAENSAGGFGLTESIANDFFGAGADCLTLGDHAWTSARPSPISSASRACCAR